jgi:UDP-N-acetyl-D-glucosamine dehydrogenase
MNPFTDGETVLEIGGIEHLNDAMDVCGAREPTFDFDIGVVGLGYVGLPTALAFNASGRAVLGLDVSDERLASVACGEADLLNSDQERLMQALEDPSFVLSSDMSMLSRAAAVVICVPTPVDPYQVPDLEILRRACATVVENAVIGQMIILTSTTYVGSTRDLLAVPLARRDWIAGVDGHVAFSPERINPGVEAFAHEDVPRVVGGITTACADAAAKLLRTSTKRVHVVAGTDAAEMTKLVENTFRAVNIALANEFANICQVLDIDVMDVVSAAATKPYGFMAFTPGPGAGGHCIPCDPHYLLWQLRRARLSVPVIEQAMIAIAARPHQVVERARRILSDQNRGLAGARVLVVGLTYKADVEDVRESPALEIVASLREQGAVVGFTDPWCPELRCESGETLVSVADPGRWGADLVVVHTHHTNVDLSWLSGAPAVLDTTYKLPSAANTIKL